MHASVLLCVLSVPSIILELLPQKLPASISRSNELIVDPSTQKCGVIITVEDYRCTREGMGNDGQSIPLLELQFLSSIYEMGDSTPRH